MAFSVVAYPETLRTLTFANWAAYTALGVPFLHPIRLFRIVNNTDATLLISFDGSTDHDVVTPNSFLLYDIASNKTAVSDEWYFAQGTQIYIKGNATVGAVYLSAYFGRS